jgi:glycosyltransferase involved in cell wall biosynthesis
VSDVPSRPRLSGIVIAKDAGATLERCLKSMRFCDQLVVVVDSESRDNTETIARTLADNVETHVWDGFGRTKSHAASLACGHWVLSIDADEEVTPQLAEAIGQFIASPPIDVNACQFRRRTRFLGRYLVHGDWGRDRVQRLFRNGKAQFSDALIHESVRAEGPHPILSGWLLHEGEVTLDCHRVRQDRYTSLAAGAMLEKGRKATLIGQLAKPPVRFLRSYLWRLGFLDGWPGLAQAWFSARYVYMRNSKARAMASHPGGV